MLASFRASGAGQLDEPPGDAEGDHACNGNYQDGIDYRSQHVAVPSVAAALSAASSAADNAVSRPCRPARRP